MAWYLALRERLVEALYEETRDFLLWTTVGLIVLSIVVRIRWTLPVDQRATLYLQYLDKPLLNRLAQALTFMGNSSTLVVLAILALGGGYLAGNLRSALFLAFALLALPLNVILKKLVSRERPGAEHARILPGPRWGYSYPSGHSMGSAAFYSLLSSQLYIHGWTVDWKLLIVVLIAAVPLGVGLSRIYLGAHWLSDVVGGWAGGIIVAVLVTAFYSP